MHTEVAVRFTMHTGVWCVHTFMNVMCLLFVCATHMSCVLASALVHECGTHDMHIWYIQVFYKVHNFVSTFNLHRRTMHNVMWVRAN